ncbi:hypothetical protein WVIC16_40009 [Weissella viridescens]|nr:hypothetical protein WVIC16_40009 [Weissella viridescens]
MGIEPTITVLQTTALPLGYTTINKQILLYKKVPKHATLSEYKNKLKLI